MTEKVFSGRTHKKQSKKVSFLPKLLIHVLAISLFMVGTVLIHAVTNNPELELWLFFNIEIPRIVVFDTGFLCIGMGFFIEFLFTFKPIYVLTRGKR